jgi:hypothetical protein
MFHVSRERVREIVERDHPGLLKQVLLAQHGRAQQAKLERLLSLPAKPRKIPRPPKPAPPPMRAIERVSVNWGRAPSVTRFRGGQS